MPAGRAVLACPNYRPLTGRTAAADTAWAQVPSPSPGGSAGNAFSLIEGVSARSATDILGGRPLRALHHRVADGENPDPAAQCGCRRRAFCRASWTWRMPAGERIARARFTQLGGGAVPIIVVTRLRLKEQALFDEF